MEPVIRLVHEDKTEKLATVADKQEAEHSKHEVDDTEDTEPCCRTRLISEGNNQENETEQKMHQVMEHVRLEDTILASDPAVYKAEDGHEHEHNTEDYRKRFSHMIR